MTAAEPVAHGTAEQLARVAHFRNLTDTLPEAHELDPLCSFLIGRVDEWADLMGELTDELDQLWSLITEDFDNDQLDELTEADWERHSFATQQQELDFRYSATIARLVGDIEGHIWLHRVVHTERARIARTGAAA
jgi:hypothetical protein